MRNGRDTNSCLFGDEIVSYIYDEIDGTARKMFEAHLQTCDECVSVFAGVSESRLGVFEWHRDEFLPLQTPHFVIPYETAVHSTGEPRYSWLDALRDLVKSPIRLATAGGAIAVLAIASFAVYFGAINSSGTFVADNDKDVKVAEVDPIPAGQTVDNPSNAQIAADPKQENAKAVSKPSSGRVITKNTRSSNPVQVKYNRRDSVRQRSIQASQTQNAPRLGNFNEAEDTSLRLADLVADIDPNDF